MSHMSSTSSPSPHFINKKPHNLTWTYPQLNNCTSSTPPKNQHLFNRPMACHLLPSYAKFWSGTDVEKMLRWEECWEYVDFPNMLIMIHMTFVQPPTQAPSPLPWGEVTFLHLAHVRNLLRLLGYHTHLAVNKECSYKMGSLHPVLQIALHCFKLTFYKEQANET